MTSSFSGLGEPVPESAGHAGTDLVARYVAGTLETVAVWSVESHLTACGRCRSALSAHADAQRLARNRSVLLVRVAIPEGGRVRRLLGRCGIPDHLLRLLAATPSLRGSWLSSVVGVLAVVTAETVAASGPMSGWSDGPAGLRNPAVLAPFLLVAPLLVLAGVAAAFLPWFDPGHQLAIAAPFDGFTLLLVRAVSALAAALVPVVGAAFLLPGPRWLPVALLLPSLALCAFALAAATFINPRTAAVIAGALWAAPVLLLAETHGLLLIVQGNAQFACVAVLSAAAVVLLTRRDRFDLGWTR